MARHDLSGQALRPNALKSGLKPLAVKAHTQQSELALTLLAVSEDCVKLFAPDGSLDFMSYPGLCAMEISDFADVKGKYWWSMWPETETTKLHDAVARANAGQHTRFEAFCPTYLGTPKWWDVAVAPILGVDGTVTQILALSRDITDLRDRNTKLEQALAESQILRREVDHRVKNSLGIVSSLLNIQARSLDDTEAAEALRAAAVRVQTIATVHDRLYHTKNLADLRLDEYLRLLCSDIAASVGAAADIRCETDLAPLVVSPDAMISLGLVLAELISNAVRHGSSGKDVIRISIALRHPAPDLAILEVSDDGTGLPPGFDPAQSRGIGMNVMMSMAQKIAGQFTFDRSAMGGALVQVCFDPAAAG